MDSSTGYVTHSLNKSKAKAAFSFPRQSRIMQLKKRYKNKLFSDKGSFYNLPSMKSNRACSLGYGQKTSLQKKDKSPPPGAYESISQFSNTERKRSAISFGLSRDKIKFANFMEQISQKRRLPAPNSYRTVLQALDKKGGRIAIKLPTQLDQINKKNIPGPGAYHPQHLDLSDAGAYFISKFKNNSSPRYHNPQHQFRKQNSRVKTLGPSSYQVSQRQFGKFVLSRFRNSIAGTFGKSKRKGLIQKDKLLIPGFKYRSFSQFGEPKKN